MKWDALTSRIFSSIENIGSPKSRGNLRRGGEGGGEKEGRRRGDKEARE